MKPIENKGRNRCRRGQKPNNSVFGPQFPPNPVVELGLCAFVAISSVVAIWAGWRPQEWFLLGAVMVLSGFAAWQIRAALRSVRDADRAYWQDLRRGGGR